MPVLEARMVDSTHLELAEPVDLPPGRKLVVSIVDTEQDDEERHQWLAVSEAGLQDAYSATEPDYLLNQIKEPNLEIAPLKPAQPTRRTAAARSLVLVPSPLGGEA